MGMFDKDKEIGTIITSFVQNGEPFILWDARIVREDFPTKLGLATQCRLSASKLASPGDRYDTTTLASAIAAKVREAEPGDFPAVVQLAEVPSPTYGGMALVLQFLKPYGRGEQNGGSSAQTAEAADAAQPATEEIPAF